LFHVFKRFLNSCHVFYLFYFLGTFFHIWASPLHCELCVAPSLSVCVSPGQSRQWFWPARGW